MFVFLDEFPNLKRLSCLFFVQVALSTCLRITESVIPLSFCFLYNSGKCMGWDVSSKWTLEKDMENYPQNLMLDAFIPAVGPATISYTIL